MADESSHSIKLMNFVSEQHLDEAKRTRGERIEDGTAQRDRPLYEAAVAAQSNIVLVKETQSVPASQEQKLAGKKNPAARPLGMIIKVKPQAKRAKNEPGEKLVKAPGADNVKSAEGDPDKSLNVAKIDLVSYSDESEDD